MVIDLTNDKEHVLRLSTNNLSILDGTNSCYHCYYVFNFLDIPNTHLTETVRCPRCNATCVLPGPYSTEDLKKIARMMFPDESEEKTSEQAVRYNKDKLDYTLLPYNALHYEAKVWHKNAKENGGKYDREQWKKLWGDNTPTVVMQSAWRHFMALHRGEVFDVDSKDCHAALLRANMAMLIEYYVKNGILPEE